MSLANFWCVFAGGTTRGMLKIVRINRTWHVPNHHPVHIPYVYTDVWNRITHRLAACHVAAMLSSDFHGWAFLHCITFVYTVRAVIHSYMQTRPPRIRCDSVPNCTLSSAREGRLESDTIPNESTHAERRREIIYDYLTRARFKRRHTVAAALSRCGEGSAREGENGVSKRTVFVKILRNKKRRKRFRILPVFRSIPIRNQNRFECSGWRLSGRPYELSYKM